VAFLLESNPVRCFCFAKTGQDRRPGSMGRRLSARASQTRASPRLRERGVGGKGEFPFLRMTPISRRSSGFQLWPHFSLPENGRSARFLNHPKQTFKNSFANRFRVVVSFAQVNRNYRSERPLLNDKARARGKSARQTRRSKKTILQVVSVYTTFLL